MNLKILGSTDYQVIDESGKHVLWLDDVSDEQRAFLDKAVTALNDPTPEPTGDGYWWCQNCKRKIAILEVTETKPVHNLCANNVEWIELIRQAGYTKDYETIPKGYELMECYMSETEYVILGDPPAEKEGNGDALHNCDQMGCGSYGGHVLARIPRLTQPTGDVAELLDKIRSKFSGSLWNDEREMVDALRTLIAALQDKVSLYECKRLPELEAENTALQSRNEFLEMALKGAADSEATVRELLENITEVDGWQPEGNAEYDASCSICGQKYRSPHYFKVETPNIPFRPKDNLCTNSKCPAVIARKALEAEK